MPEPRTFPYLRLYSRASAAFAVAVAFLVLCGWIFKVELLKTVLPGLVAMKVNTAIGLTFAGCSLWLSLPGKLPAPRRYAGRFLALLVMLISAATFSEYLWKLNLGIDQLFFYEHPNAVATSSPGRMAPTTAAAFLGIGLSLLLLDYQTRRGRRPAQPISLISLLIALISIVGYIYHAVALYRILLYTQVALHTAITLLLLSAAIFFARPGVGIAGDLTGVGSGSIMARRFLPAVFFIPLMIGWIRLRGQQAGFYGTELGLALYATSNIVVFAVLVWLSARKMNGEYDRRAKVEIDIRELNADLEERVVERTKTLEQQAVVLTQQAALLNLAQDAIVVRDMSGRILSWNRGAEAMYGWPAEEAVGKVTFELLKIELPQPIQEIEEQLLKNGHWEGQSVNETRDGVRLFIDTRWALQRDASGQPIRILTISNDITFRKQAEEALRSSEARQTHSAQHDFLTGLPNRTLLNDRVLQAIALATRHHKLIAVLFLDLDGFKHINDSLGHSIGDRLLQSIAKRLVDCVRSSDTVSRQGGDEFVVLLSEVALPEDAAITARRMLQAVSEPHSIGQHDLHVDTSIGVSIYPDDGSDAETLIKNADTAMYQAKENGRHSYKFFQPVMNVRAVERQSIEENLRRALERQEFSLHYQPKIDLRTGEISGAEALIRWTHPAHGPVPPSKFIPVAEDCGLILQIGNWVLREACKQARSWIDAGLSVGTMAVNISAIQFRDENFLDGVFRVLETTGLDAKCLELELTESVLMKRAESSEKILQTLRARGVQLAVDDFGTGYSSLSYLRKFPIDALKIDQSFIRQITTTPAEATLVTAVISMGKSLNLRVVAEGVETHDELLFLQAHECDEAQGYYFSRPVPAELFAKLLKLGIPEEVLD